jgi:hypothetical protein
MKRQLGSCAFSGLGGNVVPTFSKPTRITWASMGRISGATKTGGAPKVALQVED